MKKNERAYRAAARREIGLRNPKIPSSKVMTSKKKKLSTNRSKIKYETRKEMKYYL